MFSFLNTKRNSPFGYKNLKANQGQAMLSSVIFFLFASLVIISGIVSPIVREFKISSDAIFSKKSFFLAESGIEDMHYRLLSGLPTLVYGVYDIYINNDYTTVSVGQLVMPTSQRTIVSQGRSQGRNRTVQFVTTYQNNVLFNNGLQFGKGGILFQGTGSRVVGNILSTGPITGTNFNNVIDGTAISAGSTGLVNNLNFQSPSDYVHAHYINNSFIAGNAYYSEMNNTIVNGLSYAHWPDAQLGPFPITDTMIRKFEQTAASGGTYSGPCPYVINSGTVNLGPIRIPCGISIRGNAQVVLNGPVWVVGNINISDSAQVSVGPFVGAGYSVPMIADNPSDRITSSQISLDTVARLYGPSSGSYVMLIAMNRAAKAGFSQDAVYLRSSGNNSSVLIYAPHGHINAVTSDGSNTLQIIAGYKATLSLYDSALSGFSGPIPINFVPNLLNIWSHTRWREI